MAGEIVADIDRRGDVESELTGRFDERLAHAALCAVDENTRRSHEESLTPERRENLQQLLRACGRDARQRQPDIRGANDASAGEGDFDGNGIWLDEQSLENWIHLSMNF